MAFDPITAQWARNRAKEYTDEVAEKLAGGLKYKGSVASKEALPLSGNELGHMYTTNDTGHEWVWTIKESSGTIDNWLDLSKDLANKLDILEGDVYTGNEPYRLPYYFHTEADANKVTVTAETITLDNKKLRGPYSLDVKSATPKTATESGTAGLMSAEDKARVDRSLDILPKVDDPTDPGFGWEYHIPYNFEATPDATQLNIKLKTLTLDNKFTKMNFDKALPAATTSLAGLMSALDKVDLGNKLNKLTAGTNITIDENNVISSTGAAAINYIELEGWTEDGAWHDGGTLTDAQAQLLATNELNYIWLNGMHRLDFKYKDTSNDLSTYAASDGAKAHLIEIIPSTKFWRYRHMMLLPELVAGTNIQINSDTNTISATDTKYIAGTDIKIDGTVVSVSINSIEITGDSGEFEPEQIALLESPLTYIIRNNIRFNFSGAVMGRGQLIATYVSTAKDDASTITVSIFEKLWLYTNMTLQLKLIAGKNITIDDNTISAADGLPEGTASGEAIIFDGELWKTQEGYGFIKYEVTDTFTWDGTTSEAKIDTSLGEMHKIANPSILPTEDNVAPTKCTYLDGGNEYTVKWKDATLYMMGTNTLFGQCSDLFMVVVYQDGTRISFFDEKEFSKGIWFNKKNENTYITSIESANPTTIKIDSKFIPSDDTKANNNEVVKLSGDQDIYGNKGFHSPIVYTNGTSATTIADKKIVTSAAMGQTINYQLPNVTGAEETLTTTLATETYVDEKTYSAALIYIPNDIVTTINVGNMAKGTTISAGTSVLSILNDILVGKNPVDTYFYYGISTELPTSIAGLTAQEVSRLDLLLNGITKGFTTRDLYIILAISKTAKVKINWIITSTLNAELSCVTGYGADSNGMGYDNPFETTDDYIYALPKANGTYTYKISFVGIT